MVFEAADGSGGVVSLFDMSFVTFVDIVVEWVFEGQGVSLVGALDSDGEGSDDGFVGSPGVGYESGGVEESGSDDVGFEVFFDSALFHVPSDNFDG